MTGALDTFLREFAASINESVGLALAGSAISFNNEMDRRFGEVDRQFGEVDRRFGEVQSTVDRRFEEVQEEIAVNRRLLQQLVRQQAAPPAPAPAAPAAAPAADGWM